MANANFNFPHLGPAMLEVRQASSLRPVGVEWTPGGTPESPGAHHGGPSVAALFGGAASVLAAVAGLSSTSTVYLAL